jgi:hypothetical protein
MEDAAISYNDAAAIRCCGGGGTPRHSPQWRIAVSCALSAKRMRTIDGGAAASLLRNPRSGLRSNWMYTPTFGGFYFFPRLPYRGSNGEATLGMLLVWVVLMCAPFSCPASGRGWFRVTGLAAHAAGPRGLRLCGDRAAGWRAMGRRGVGGNVWGCSFGMLVVSVPGAWCDGAGG